MLTGNFSAEDKITILSASEARASQSLPNLKDARSAKTITVVEETQPKKSETDEERKRLDKTLDWLSLHLREILGELFSP